MQNENYNNRQESFTNASWRGTTPVRTPLDVPRIGVSFDLETGETVRILLDLESARHTGESIGEYLDAYKQRSHSEISSGIPSIEGSVPDEGKNV